MVLTTQSACAPFVGGLQGWEQKAHAVVHLIAQARRFDALDHLARLLVRLSCPADSFEIICLFFDAYDPSFLHRWGIKAVHRRSLCFCLRFLLVSYQRHLSAMSLVPYNDRGQLLREAFHRYGTCRVSGCRAPPATESNFCNNRELYHIRS